jgi:membrane protein
MKIRQAWGLVKEAVSAWSQDYAPSMGAALSYYTLFSIGPLLLIVIAVAGLAFGADAVQGAILAQIRGLMGDTGAKAIEEMLVSASRPDKGGFATVLGIGGLLLGATTVFNELQNDLDRIWRAPARKKSSGFFTLVRSRLLSFGLILGMAFVTMVSLVMTAAVAALGKWWGPLFAGWEAIAHLIDLVVSVGLLTVGFAMIYKIMPRVHIQWRDVWVGAGVTSLLFTVGKFLIGLYLGKSDVASSFGAAGSMVIVMLWVYYSTQIFLFGAEFTWVYAHAFGSRRGMPRPQAAVIDRAEGPADASMPEPKSEDRGPVAAPEAAAVEAVPVAATPDGRVLAPSAECPPKPLWPVGLAAGAGLLIGALANHGSWFRRSHRAPWWRRVRG